MRFTRAQRKRLSIVAIIAVFALMASVVAPVIAAFFFSG